MVCWNFQITKQTIEHKLWALSRYKKSPLYKRIKTIRAISCIGIMLFLAGLEIYEVLFRYTPKPHIIFGFAIADFIIMFLTWNLTPWATVKGELLSGAISGRLAALQGPHCITIADGIYRSYGGLDVGGYVQRNSSDLDEVVIDPLGLLLQFKDQSSDFIPKAALQPGQSTNECREIILHALNSSADRIAEIENVIEEERILPDSLLTVRYSINRAEVGGMFAEVFRALRRSRNYWKSQWRSSVISGAIFLLTSLVAIAEIQKGNWFVMAALLFGLGGWGWILYANRPGSYIKRAKDGKLDVFCGDFQLSVYADRVEVAGPNGITRIERQSIYDVQETENCVFLLQKKPIAVTILPKKMLSQQQKEMLIKELAH